MLFEIEGKVIAKLPIVSGVSAKGEWKKATVILEFMDGEYPSKLALENMKKADDFNNIAVGSNVKVKFSVSSRENNGRYYTGANCVSWEVLSSSGVQADKPTGTKDNLPF